METIDDKFKRFLAMTDRPESFSDEELMELALDPDMAAWYAALSEAERAVKCKTEVAPLPASRPRALMIALLATAAMLTVAFLLWPERLEDTITQPEELAAVAEAMHQQPEQKPVISEVMQPETKQLTSSVSSVQTKTIVSEQMVISDHQPKGLPAKVKQLQTSEPATQPAIPVANVQQEELIAEASKPFVQEERPFPTSSVPLPASDSQREIVMIPPDRQALADIYLAEAALQVAYERQAQAQALRAYAASLEDEEGDEPAQPIIAF